MRYLAIASAFALAASAMLATVPAKAGQITSGGKCWVNTSNGNYGWTDCPKEHHNGKHK
jgi:DIM protein